ncbi:MAG: LLM class flavin-dependent oxidoreductase [Acidimicrobiia bacterium]|jgi:alkanesulfonate monooxygenase SsuD/methylene tetrahydromethanopterin reductase-like flavin-dependent oxidoreductase (luciferase family)
MFTMRFDLRVPGKSPAEIADQYAAAIEMAEWAEDKGCVAAVISEHHASPDGYLPAPVILATAMAARTKTLSIAVGAALLPLYDPVKLAEEMIVLDHISRGRVSYVFGIGYRSDEYDLFGLPYEQRGRLADEKLDKILEVLDASSAATRDIRITPAPFTPGRPAVSWGGASKAAARRAGSRGLDLFGSGTCEGIEETYAEAARAAGREPGQCMVPQPGTPMTVFVNDDQDTGWAEVGPYLMNDVLSYAEWNEDSKNVASLSYSKTAEELRAERGAHRIFTVDEAVEYAKTAFVLPLHPLCGGLAPEVAWPYLRRVVDEVMPRLAG